MTYISGVRNRVPKVKPRWKSSLMPFSYPEPFLRAVRRGALAKSITGYHKNMVRKQYSVLELANQMPVRNMDLARAPRRTARKKGSRYENGLMHVNISGSGNFENDGR